MPKYLVEARYNAEGAKGIARDGGSGRHAPAKKAIESLGGKLESFYFAFGDTDVFAVFDLPDNASAAASSLAVNQTGLLTSKIVVLLTPEEMDAAAKKTVDFRAPGR